MSNMKREYLELTIKRILKDNKNIDVVSLIADLLTDDEERYRFAADMSDSMYQIANILGVSERTAYRNLGIYEIKLKEKIR